MLTDNYAKRVLSRDGNTVYIITNHLFHIPLYAFYLITIEMFYPDEIEGVLMTPPFDFEGPYQDCAQAEAVLNLRLSESKPS